KFPIGYGYVNTKPFKIKDKTYILAKYENKNDIHIEPKLMLFDLYSNKFKEKKLQKNTERLNFAFLNYNKSFADIRIIDESKKMIYKISPDLTLTDPIKTFEGYHSNVTCTIDIDRDNNKELLFLSNDLEKILITRNDFSFPVIISIPNNHQGIKAITIKKRGPNLPPLLAIQFSRVLYLFSYTKNPLYFFKYLIYLGIFIFTYLLIYLLQKINSVKLEKEKQQLELEIRKRTLDISEKNKHLKEFKKEITLSIDYAKYIQDSIFPKQESLIEIFKESFLIFLPRDIVSGDFYWWTKVDNSIYLSVSDCTGHGVPGAFMSILGITYLQQTIMIEDVKKPALILNNLRQKIIRALKQTGEPNEQYDGMDMILLQIDQKTNTVYFSGAHNSIYVVTENDFFAYNLSLKNSHQVRVEKKGKIFFIEIKGDRMPVAIYKKMDDFSEVRIKVKKGDTIYSFTDGYYDQFGGTYGKKIKLAPIKTMLINNYYDSMTYQKQSLLDYLQYWKENHHLKTKQFDQIDDITILGIKF
ncbi:MAG TPA: hypothetical protein EYP69_06100, partial [Bacteroidales bacterium]|nr:hypothetical protein [Bacteroidales bacterium]